MPPRKPTPATGELSLPFEDPTLQHRGELVGLLPAVFDLLRLRRRTVLEFVVDGDPVGKARARVSARMGADGQMHAHAYTPANTRAWETAVALAAKEAMAQGQMHARAAGATAYTLSVCAAVKRPQRLCRRKDPDGYILRTTTPDADNVAKSVADALQLANAVPNDCLIVYPECVSLYAPKGTQGHTWVRLYRIDEPFVLG